MDELNISGAGILFEFYGIQITEAILNMWIVILLVFIACVVLTRKLKTNNITKRQAVAETIVKLLTNLTTDNMGKKYLGFAPFVGAIFCLSALCSLSSLFGMYSATADLSVLLGWSLLVYGMITYTKIKTNKLSGYLKGFAQPVAILTPFNIISEVATPISMSFRHFGNIASGSVIMTLLNMALTYVSHLVLGAIPIQSVSNFPLFQIGVPAIASLYFDVFSAFLQAYIFCMLTTLYISNAAETD